MLGNAGRCCPARDSIGGLPYEQGSEWDPALVVCSVALAWLLTNLFGRAQADNYSLLLFASLVATPRFWAVSCLASVLLQSAITSMLILLWFVYRYSVFVRPTKGLPILLYHKVSLHQNDRLTISVDRLDRQLTYIKSMGYTPISFLELRESLEGRHQLPDRPVLVTFDDGYRCTYELAYPLLLKHQFKATIFLPGAYIGGVDGWNNGAEPLMSYAMIRQMGGSLVEFGLHSYLHGNYEFYSAAQVEADLSRCVRTLEERGIPFTRVFAYPYGRMPKDENVNQAMREIFLQHGIDFAVRIGSRINALPPRDLYELKRTGVRGTDSFWEFKIKLQKGRAKLI